MELSDVWSRLVAWPDAEAPGQRIRFEADAAARERLAGWLGLEAVKSLEADLELTPWLDGVRIVGDVRGVVERICGVSLEPFDERIAKSVDARRVPPGSSTLPAESAADREGELPEQDPPEAGQGAGVDIAVFCVEVLSLALDPYPRKPGVEFSQPAEDRPPSPFAALAHLRSGTQEP